MRVFLIAMTLSFMTMGQSIQALEVYKSSEEISSLHHSLEESYDECHEITEDCHNCNDCTNGTDGHCACTHIHPHVFLVTYSSSAVRQNLISSSHGQWYFYNDYHSPFLDPALKPPSKFIHS